MSDGELQLNEELTYSQKDLQPLDLNNRPMWVFDIENKSMWWANRAALALWDADSLASLLNRDFASDMSDVTEARLLDYLQRFHRHETISEQWTFYPKGHPQTLVCHCSGVRIDDGRLAMLVQAQPVTPQTAQPDTLRGVEALRYTPVMISMISLQGELLFQNPAAGKAFDTTGPLHHHFIDHFADVQQGHQSWQRVIDQGRLQCEAEIETRAGTRWHSLQCRLTDDPTSGDRVVLVNQQDLTETYRAKQRYQQLFSANKAVMLLIDPTDGQIVDANQAAVDFYGYDLAQLTALKISRINTLSPEQIEVEMQRAREERRNKFHFRHRLASGAIRDVEVHSGPLELAGRTLLYSIIQDITEQRAAEQALAASELRHRYIIDHTPAGFWLVDTTQHTLQVNEALCRMIGYTMEEMLGRHPLEFVDEENGVILAFQMSKIGTRKQRAYELALRHKDGRNIPTHFSATTMYDESGKVQGSFAFISDLSELKRAEAARRQSDKLLHTAFENAVNGIALVRLNGSFHQVNPAFCSMLGYSEAELLGMNVNDITHPDDQAISTALTQDLLTGRRRKLQAEKRYLRKDGSLMWGSINAAAVRNEEGMTLYTIAQIEDITERRQTAETLEKLSRAVEHSGNSVIITDRQGVIDYVNPHFCRISGYAMDEVIGKTPAMLKSGHNEDTTYRNLWGTILEGREWRGELLNRSKRGDLYWTLLNITPIRNEAGEISHFIGVSEDITALKEAHARVEHLALYDSLTGLANRRLFSDRLKQATEAIRRNHSQAALLYLDLDHFKHINDALGHDIGDRLLQLVAKRLQHCVRQQDTIARLGGDEFAILLPQVDGIKGARTVAGKVIEILSQSVDLPGYHNPVSTSIGITLAPDDSLQPEELMKNADLALYSAKAKGRNNFQFFTEEMNDEVFRRLNIEHELLQALTNEQFEIHYQPIRHLQTGRMVAAEALIRWNHPHRGMLYPDYFIQIAEETGLIHPMSEWLLQTVCQDSHTMQEAGLQFDWVSINISARQFQHPDFFERTATLLKHGCHQPKRLKLELTESALMENTTYASETLQQFRAMGLGLSIDDFGTGYSSFAYLKRFPVDSIKVDRSFVTDIPQDRNDMEITSAIIAMACKLGLLVIAEGIETKEQLAFLRENGCTYGQGYLLGRPMPLADLLNLETDNDKVMD